jgi:YidC/Oxa1 family membrane protein insertase
MDKRTLLAMMLCLGLFYVWAFVTGMGDTDNAPETDSVTELGENNGTSGQPDVVVENSVNPLTPPPAQPVVTESSIPVEIKEFQGCGANFHVTTDGGFFRDVSFQNYSAAYDMQPLYSWLFGFLSGSTEGSWKPYGDPPGPQIIATSSAQLLGMGSGELESPSPRVRIVQKSNKEWTIRGVTANGIEVSRAFQIDDQVTPCVIRTQLTWKNTNNTTYDGNLWLSMHDRVPAVGAGYYSHAAMPAWMTGGSDNSWPSPNQSGWFSGALDGPKKQEGNVDYFGMTDGYFSIVLLNEKPEEQEGSYIASPRSNQVGPLEDPELTEKVYGGYYVHRQTLAPGAMLKREFTLYTGENKPSLLAELDNRLTYLVDLGWFSFFGWPLLYMLNMFYGLIGNWGFSIIFLTLTVKLLFFPLTQKAFKSSQRMQALQPEMKKIREEFKNSPEELNRRTMQLFREHKVNPLGGCLPMIIQMPIWIALYRVLLQSVDLFHTEWFYLRDLSSTDPYCILPVIVVGLMLVQQRFMPTGNMDPNQARMMKMMPLIFGFFFFTFPSGLVLYIFVNMCLTILQQWIIKKQFGTPEPIAATAA